MPITIQHDNPLLQSVMAYFGGMAPVYQQIYAQEMARQRQETELTARGMEYPLRTLGRLLEGRQDVRNRLDLARGREALDAEFADARRRRELDDREATARLEEDLDQEFASGRARRAAEAFEMLTPAVIDRQRQARDVPLEPDFLERQRAADHGDRVALMEDQLEELRRITREQNTLRRGAIAEEIAALQGDELLPLLAPQERARLVNQKFDQYLRLEPGSIGQAQQEQPQVIDLPQSDRLVIRFPDGRSVTAPRREEEGGEDWGGAADFTNQMLRGAAAIQKAETRERIGDDGRPEIEHRPSMDESIRMWERHFERNLRRQRERTARRGPASAPQSGPAQVPPFLQPPGSAQPIATPEQVTPATAAQPAAPSLPGVDGGTELAPRLIEALDQAPPEQRPLVAQQAAEYLLAKYPPGTPPAEWELEDLRLAQKLRPYYQRGP